jgi:isorenieratene synthase
MRRELLDQPCGGAERLTSPMRVAVAGGGIAGLAAACVLAERGARVAVIEKEAFLGGRAGAWTESIEPIGELQMERGFHAFFRQYYNLRALIARVDPELEILEPLDDYPILGPAGTESFANLSRRVPLNVAQLVYRTRTMGLRDLARVNARSALAMLTFDAASTYAAYDHLSARDYLDGLRFPPAARQMLFDVFAHSFFNPEASMSAAELLMMFHFYFTGNPEGLIFDVARRPFSVALWEPLADYLSERGAEIATAEEVAAIDRRPGGLSVRTSRRSLDVDACVLALPVAPLKAVVAASPDLGDPALRDGVDSLELTSPFAVWRLWLDRPTAPGRSPFVGTTGVGVIDNISLYHLFEDESRDWAARTGGAVVELHAYAVPEDMGDEQVRAELLAGMHRFYPETREATAIAERYLRRRDCPAFAPGSWIRRPGVATAIDGLALAGDFVKLEAPCALMERAAMSGMLAANHLLALRGVAPEPIWTVPRRGILRRKPWCSDRGVLNHQA